MIMANAKRWQSAIRLYFAGAAALGAAAAVFQTFLYYAWYDESLNLYKNGSPAFVFYCAAAVCVLFLVSFIIAAGKSEPELDISGGDGYESALPSTGSRFMVFASVLCGFQLSSSSIIDAYYYFKGEYTGLTALKAAAMVLAVAASLYFFFNASRRPKKKVLQYLSFAVIIWAVVYLMSIYFDMSAPLNCPVRILNQMALIGIMLYFTFEARCLLGRPKLRFYFAAAFATVFMISMNSIPDMIITFAGYRQVGQDTLFRVAEISILLYIIARIRSFALYGATGEQNQ